jgi:acetyltransferase-like isoleucine patch superfamily enzyme
LVVSNEQLLKQLRTLRQTTDVLTKAEWKRSLPFLEALSNRRQKAKELQMGEGSSCYENVYVYGEPRIGKNVWIGPFVVLDATGGLAIGDWCEISCNVMIFTHSTHLCALSGDKSLRTLNPVNIGEHTYVGSGSVILPGITIGHHSVIGAGSIVTKGVPPYTVAFGVPARRVGKVTFPSGVPTLKYKKPKRNKK